MIPKTSPTAEQRTLTLGTKTYSADKAFYHGTHRVVPPEQTIEKIWSVAPAVGLTRLADVTGLDRIGIPTVIGVRPDAITLAVSGGKGFTTEAASASAGMEAIEIWHAENVCQDVVLETHANLESAGLAAPMQRLPFTRHSLFDAHQPEPWVLGWDLIQQREMAVPYTQVSMGNCEHQRTKRWLPFASGSNGLAGGNHILEALAAALYELVERDAIACSSFSGSLKRRRVALSSIEDPLVLALIEKLNAASVSVYLFDCTVDTSVPTYLAVIEDRIDLSIGRYKGSGAHLDPSIAMIRAITEAAQSRLLLIAGSRDDYFWRDQQANRYLSSSRTDELSVPELSSAGLQRSEATDSFAADIHVIRGKLEAIGIDSAVVVDLTRHDVGIPVVRVIVPGLEGYMFDHYEPGWHAKAYRSKSEVSP